MSFESGQRVRVRPGTFHNPDYRNRTLEATFISYMAGREYAVLLVRNPDPYNIRVRVEDLLDANYN